MVRFVEDDGDDPSPASGPTPVPGTSPVPEPVEGLAPIIPLFGGRTVVDELAVAQQRHPAGSALSGRGRPTERAGRVMPEASALESAERALLRRLTARSLSVAEARGVLAGHRLAPDEVERLVEVFEGRGYLDDAALAEQLVHVAVDRKGEGRRAIATTLARRGVPRDIAAEALASLPDDDRDRALEFARSRVRSLQGLDRQAALRRLTGQLARRGYPGSVAMDAARTALAEAD